jgi:hypothetical protein
MVTVVTGVVAAEMIVIVAVVAGTVVAVIAALGESPGVVAASSLTNVLPIEF